MRENDKQQDSGEEPVPPPAAAKEGLITSSVPSAFSHTPDIAWFPDHILWDLLDDVSFWIKDAGGRFIWVNRTLAEQAHATREAIIGTTDRDWFFYELASVYMEDDARIAGGGEPILNKPELAMEGDGDVLWHVTSKFPLRNAAGEVVGSFGISRPMEEALNLPAEYADLSKIVSYARAHVSRGITVEALAKEANQSLATLERYIRRHLRVTPRELLQRIRMNRARHLLSHSSLKVGEIALECGYESFSSFSRAFRKTYGCAPGAFRKR